MRFLLSEKISKVAITGQPNFINNTYPNKAQRYGIAYERQVNAQLIRQFGDFYRPKIWLRYRNRGKSTSEYCELDGLLFQPEKARITIVEIKIRHTTQAWFQLEAKYLPLIRCLFQGCKWQFATCEVVKYWKPIKLPVATTIRNSVDLAKPGEFAVCIMRP